MARITVVIPVLNQFPLLRQNLELLTKENSPEDFDVLIIDNGSDEEFHTDIPNVSVIRFDEPIGVYPCFQVGLENTDSEILCFMHSDFFFWNPRWYKQIEGAFNGNSKLGLVGCIGSDDWSYNGGRGGGTMGSFQGKTIGDKWSGSHISGHGKDITGRLQNAVQVDGCCMIFRRQALQSIGFRDDIYFHFYDRIMSAQILEKGWKIAVLGIECDHVSNQTAGNESAKYWPAAKKFCIEHNIPFPEDTENFDSIIYQDAEQRYLKEWRDEKHFFPMRLDKNTGEIVRY
jgi:glycosyltransferase involved in cell wall biosynthesis